MSKTLEAQKEKVLQIIQDYDVRYALEKKRHEKAVAKGVTHDEINDDFRIERGISYVPAKKELQRLYNVGELESQIMAYPRSAMLDLFSRPGFIEALRNLEADGLIAVNRDHESQWGPMSVTLAGYSAVEAHGRAGAICPYCKVTLSKTVPL